MIQRKTIEEDKIHANKMVNEDIGTVLGITYFIIFVTIIHFVFQS